MGNRVRYRFSIGIGAFHAGYRQGVDVDGIAGSKAGLGCLKFLLTRCRKSLGQREASPWGTKRSAEGLLQASQADLAFAMTGVGFFQMSRT